MTSAARPAADQDALAADLLIESLHHTGLPRFPASQVLDMGLVKQKIHAAGTDPAVAGRYDRPTLHLRPKRCITADVRQLACPCAAAAIRPEAARCLPATVWKDTEP